MSVAQAERDGEIEKEEEEEKAFKDTFEAQLVIHKALHLPMMTDKLQYVPYNSYNDDLIPAKWNSLLATIHN